MIDRFNDLHHRPNFAATLSALVALACWTACDEAPSATETITEPAPSATADRAAASTATAVTSGAAASPSSCPEGMEHIESFCVDTYEAQLVRLSDGAPHSPYERPKTNVGYAAVSRAGVPPQAYISRVEAADACRAAGKRLCGAAEWYRACSGPKRTRYPYGNNKVKGRCNTDKGHLLTIVFGEVKHSYYDHYNNPLVNQEPNFLARTGEYADCKSAEGAMDMVGNLHEWIADDVSSRLRRELPLELGDQWLGKRGMGVFMGGYFSSHAEHGRGCLYATMTHAPEYHDYSTGFRCCKDARP